MLNFLIKKFVKDSENVNDSKVRTAYGTLCSVYGIILNIILFAVKYIAGVISNSVGIMSDAFNNLSDAGSSLITLFGFALSNKKPDPDHPFGHGRVEYLSGLAVSVIIIIMGFSLAQTSIKKIIAPEEVEASIVSILILVVSILVKFYMSAYNKRIGKKIGSAAMQATATDSLSDSISTAVVLICMIISGIFNINIDGYAGLAVAVFIFRAGILALKDTIAPLLGQPPEKEFVDEIESTVMAHSEVKGIHDLIVHDYGPGRLMITLHAEVDGHADFFESHDAIDCIEQELNKKFNCLSTIHLDPIDLSDERVNTYRSKISEMVKEKIDSSVTIHDLRIVPGTTHTNIIFDAVLPQNFKMSDEEARKTISDSVSEMLPGHYAVINIDHSYV